MSALPQYSTYPEKELCENWPALLDGGSEEKARNGKIIWYTCDDNRRRLVHSR